MKLPIFPAIAVMAACVISASAQQLPGAPDTNGLTPRTATIYINGTNGPNFASTESIGVAIANNGNVMVGWEDGDAVWTLFDADGNWLLSRTNYFSYFQPDGSPVQVFIEGSQVDWGGKWHANLFGSGIGMGSAGTDALAGQLAAYAGYLYNGNFPLVQLLNNSGGPLTTNLAGVSVAYATDPSDIRIGDWEYLANGNIVIVSENRQTDDLVNLYGGENPGRSIIYRILTPAGAVVQPETLANDTPVPGQMWNGVGVTKDGFAVRFEDSTRGVCVRMFNNNGTPTTTNLVLTTLTGLAQAGGGGRGDGAGFQGNGKDAYVHAAGYNNGGVLGFWVTVLNTNGTVRWTRDVSDDMVLGSVQLGGAAIDESGQVIVVFAGKPVDYPNDVVMGRRFDATGNPLGGTFYVSEKEVPNVDTPPSASDTPRVYWRNGNVAIVWVSRNDPYNPEIKEIAQRYFLTVPPSLSISRSGNNVTISWPPGVAGFTLESSGSVAPGLIWSPVAVVNNSVTLVNPSDTRFYRLKK